MVIIFRGLGLIQIFNFYDNLYTMNNEYSIDILLSPTTPVGDKESFICWA